MDIVKTVKRGHLWLTLEEENKEKYESTKSGLVKPTEVFTPDSQQIGIAVQLSSEIKPEECAVGDRILLPPNAKMTMFKLNGEDEYYLMPYSEVLSVLK